VAGRGTTSSLNFEVVAGGGATSRIDFRRYTLFITHDHEPVMPYDNKPFKPTYDAPYALHAHLR